MTPTNKASAPYIDKPSAITSIMADVLLAMIPPLLWSVYVFGARSVVIVMISIAISAVSDFSLKKFVFKNNTPFELSGIITGALVGLCLPVSSPLWLPAFAAVAAIGLGKYAAGGMGKNLFNPAVSGICVSYCLFGRHMTVFTKPFEYLPAFDFQISDTLLSGVRVTTSLDIMRDGKIVTSSIGDYFYGISPGTIGTISTALIIVSLLYLLIRRTVGIRTTLSYIMALVVLMFFTAYADAEPIDFVAMQLFSGGIAFIAVFMLNDYTATPSSMAGKIVFGVVCAAFTVAVRYFGAVHYGEYFAVLAANMLVPFIDKVTEQRVYGSYIRRGRDA